MTFAGDWVLTTTTYCLSILGPTDFSYRLIDFQRERENYQRGNKIDQVLNQTLTVPISTLVGEAPKMSEKWF